MISNHNRVSRNRSCHLKTSYVMSLGYAYAARLDSFGSGLGLIVRMDSRLEVVTFNLV